MGRRDRVRVTLTDEKGMAPLSEEEIRTILRAADDIIMKAGRTMLAKILKGSRDKAVLENSLDTCPSYGSFKCLTIEEITKKVDWMIRHNYLEIDYNGRLPMIVFSEIGWDMYKPQYAAELIEKILFVADTDSEALVMRLKATNREVVILILEEISESGNPGLNGFLEMWEAVEVKKVRAMIREAEQMLRKAEKKI